MLDRIIQFIGFFFFGIALWLIAEEVRKVGFEHLFDLMLTTPWWVICLMLLFTFLDYVALSGYDVLSLQYIQKHVPYPTVLKAAGIGFAVSNTVGHAYASGGSIRYLIYTPRGLTHFSILTLIAFEALTFLIGMAVVYVLAVSLAPFEHTLANYAHIDAIYISGVCVIIAAAFYYLMIIRPKRHIKIAGADIKAPTRQMTLKQIIVGVADNFAVSLVFYTIVRYHIDISFLPVFIVFIIAQTIGVSTQVPGGIGIFEGLILFLLPHASSERGQLLSALIIFRCLYFFLPFLLACLYLASIWAHKKITSIAR